MTNYGVAISMPFRFGTEQGVVSNGALTKGTGGALVMTSDYRTIWKDRVFNALLTEVQERVMRPDYGTQVLKSLFDTEEAANAAITTSVQSALSIWLPDLTVKDVTASYDSTYGYLNVDVEYILPDGGQDTLSTQIKTATFNQYGNIISTGA